MFYRRPYFLSSALQCILSPFTRPLPLVLYLLSPAVGHTGHTGHTGQVSTVFLALGAMLVSTLWRENTRNTLPDSSDGAGANAAVESDGESDEGGIMAGLAEIRKDPRIALVGAVQSLFEGAMYIFVLQWPPAFKAVLESVPFGRVFSCFMASCMVGSSTFSALASKGVKIEAILTGMLALATCSIGCSAAFGSQLGVLIASFFAFEACVGAYFPCINTLKSRSVVRPPSLPSLSWERGTRTHCVRSYSDQYHRIRIYYFCLLACY